MEWQNAQGDDCVLSFIVDDDYYTGDPITIFGGPRPFVLSEFNTDNDIFKPIRPQQATIEVLASANGVDIEDFIIEEDDREMQVRFDFGAFTGYWYGVLSQDDMSEIWIAQNHILTLRADEGFGSMKTIPLQNDAGELLNGLYTPFQLIQYAATETVQSFFNCNVISNLFHESMTRTSTDTGIDQCYVDSRTFDQGFDNPEDSYTVLEKINRAFSQTIFQWQGQWWIVRVEDLFVPPTSNIRGFQNNKPVGGQRSTFNTRWMINVGYDQRVKPVMPEMIKTLNKPSKVTKVKFRYQFPANILCNQNFQAGTIITDTSTEKTYTITNWNLYKTSRETPVPATNVFQRKVTISALGDITDNYAMIVKDSLAETWAASCEIVLQENDIIDFSLQYRTTGNFGGDIKVAQVQLKRIESLQYRYGLNNDGEWIQCTTDWDSANNPYLSLSLDVTQLANTWTSIDVTSRPVPYRCIAKVLLVCPVIGPGAEAHFKDIQLGILSNNNGVYDRRIVGNFDQYTISRRVMKDSESEIYLDDASSLYVKGALFEDDGATLTTKDWLRRRYDTERYGFKRQNAIANWWVNRKYRTRLECNFYGLKWERSGSVLPIGMINTINFVDDAPTKTFWIANLKEVDFMACTWQANLVEIWDTTTDEDVEPTANDVHLNDYYYE